MQEPSRRELGSQRVGVGHGPCLEQKLQPLEGRDSQAGTGDLQLQLKL